MKTVYLGVLLLTVVAATAFPATAQEAQKGKISILGSGGIPVGDFSDINKPGLGGLFQLTGSPAAAPELSLGGTVGVMRFSGKEVNVFGLTFNTADATFIPILATVQYTFKTDGNVKPYLQTNVGVYHVRAGEETISVGGFTETIGTSSSSHFGYTAGGGLLIQMSPNKSWFNVQAAYHKVGEGLEFLNVYAGVSAAFGR